MYRALNDLLLPTKLVTLGIVVGAASGLTIAQFNPGPTLAAVAEKPPFTIGSALSTSLAKFDGRYFALGTEPSVSLEATSATTVRKIGYGETSFVNIVTTPTGTYSSDAMFNPHVRYPGVFVEPMHLHFAPFSGVLYGWSRLTGWEQIPVTDAHSFGYLDSEVVPASSNGVCVADTDEGGCR
jgi:hypothetical protein